MREVSTIWRQPGGRPRIYCRPTRTRAVPLAEIYEVWRRAPLGIKNGLLPVLAVAFLLSERGTLAFYRQGIFQARVSDLDIDYLAKDPAAVQLRWMDLTGVSRLLLSEMADVVRDLDEIERAQSPRAPRTWPEGLVAIHDRLPAWVGRTQRLSHNAKHIRQLFKQAKDPNRLIFRRHTQGARATLKAYRRRGSNATDRRAGSRGVEWSYGKLIRRCSTG